MRHRPFLIIVSSPSGGGKTTIRNRLLQVVENLAYSVSATTRPKRPGEIDGKDYIFVSRDKFLKWIEEGELLEWAEVYGNFYGTPKTPILRYLSQGKDVLLDLEVNGKRSVEFAFPGRTVSIFILPPDLETIKKRLIERGTESGEALQKRLQLIQDEMEHAFEYDYWVVNDTLEQAVNRIVAIIEAERLKADRALYAPLRKGLTI